MRRRGKYCPNRILFLAVGGLSHVRNLFVERPLSQSLDVSYDAARQAHTYMQVSHGDDNRRPQTGADGKPSAYRQTTTARLVGDNVAAGGRAVVLILFGMPPLQLVVHLGLQTWKNTGDTPAIRLTWVRQVVANRPSPGGQPTRDSRADHNKTLCYLC